MGDAATIPAPGAAERWARPAEGRAAGVDLMVPGISCAGCMRTIETGLGKLDGVTSARVNLSMRRVRVLYDPATG
ncbi:MAG: heavy metal-associated domain-containing protein, partial [Paracoccaceae bacterium]